MATPYLVKKIASLFVDTAVPDETFITEIDSMQRAFKATSLNASLKPVTLNNADRPIGFCKGKEGPCPTDPFVLCDHAIYLFHQDWVRIKFNDILKIKLTKGCPSRSPLRDLAIKAEANLEIRDQKGNVYVYKGSLSLPLLNALQGLMMSSYNEIHIHLPTEASRKLAEWAKKEGLAKNDLVKLWLLEKCAGEPTGISEMPWDFEE